MKLAKCRHWALVHICVLAFWSGAFGQTFEEWLSPHISREGFAAILPTLGLQEHEAIAAQAAFDEYLAAFAAQAAAVQPMLEELRAGKRSDWMTANYELLEARLRLENQLEERVAAAITNDVQRMAWTRAMRDIRRAREIKALRESQRIRYACDLVAVVNALVLSDAERARIPESVDGYSEQLDSLLRDLQRKQIEHIRAQVEYTTSRETLPEGDPAKLQRLMGAVTQWMELTEHIGRLCNDSAQAIGANLEPDNRAALHEAVDRSAYPEAFAKCPAELAVEAIRLTPDVAADKREAVEAIYADYIGPRDDLRRRIVAMVRPWSSEETSLKQQVTRAWEQSEGGPMTVDERNAQTTELRRQHPVNPLLERRHDLAIETVSRMRNVFTDDEIERMPLAVRLCLNLQGE